MQVEQIVSLILHKVPGAEIEVEGEGCNFSAVVVSEEFKGLSPVKRQQLVLSAVSEQLRTGELHAMSVKALTADEVASKSSSPLSVL